MITLRRDDERHHEQHRQQSVWLTFYPRDRANPFADGFGALESLSENRLPPRARAPRLLHHKVEILTYVREGALVYEDSSGRSGVLHAGEFQLLSVTGAIRRSETNASQTRWAQVFQIWLRLPQGRFVSDERLKRFSVAERRGNLCLLASPDSRRGSLRMYQDACLYSALLNPGQHLVHELAPGRGAWLHLVQGKATCGGSILRTGDGVGITAERAVSLTAEEETEILLFDLSGPMSWRLVG
jgi:hypothetical protein